MEAEGHLAQIAAEAEVRGLPLSMRLEGGAELMLAEAVRGRLSRTDWDAFGATEWLRRHVEVLEAA